MLSSHQEGFCTLQVDVINWIGLKTKEKGKRVGHAWALLEYILYFGLWEGLEVPGYTQYRQQNYFRPFTA